MHLITCIASFCGVLPFLLSAAQLLSQPTIFSSPLSPRIANYKIDVRLDTETRTLHGEQKLTWRNDSDDHLTELQFHLYLNAFRNERSTFMKEARGWLHGRPAVFDHWGAIDVESIWTEDGEDLAGQIEFIHPDDDNEEDSTSFRLPLLKPLPPGETIVLNMDFTARLPEPPLARSGTKADYFFAGQWFPKIGVYIDGAWNCHQYHANSEFFADFGVYDVRITVPEKNIVGATGIEVSVTKNGDGTATHYYRAEDVHDFAWTTSPAFVEFSSRVQDVDIRLLLQPDHIRQAQRHLEAARVAVEYFQNWYGDYPFPNLTVVDPRRGAGGTGGMEYPTLITGATYYNLPAGLRLVEQVIIHEFGHNYWYHLVASNEFEESWLDEGINTFAESEIMNAHYGEGELVDFLGIKVDAIQYKRLEYLLVPSVDPVVQDSWEFVSELSYAANSYAKPALILATLRDLIGAEKMKEILRTYLERWRFKHPKTEDFVAVANQVAGTDLSWFFEQALYSTAVLDYAVDSLYCSEIAPAEPSEHGRANADSASRLHSASERLGPHDSSTGVIFDSLHAPARFHRSGVQIHRLGEFKFPVEVLLIFENGERVNEHWDGQELSKQLVYLKPARLLSAEIDPERKVLLDVNLTNNSKTLEKQNLGINKLAARFLFLMQFLMDQPEVANFLLLLNL